MYGRPSGVSITWPDHRCVISTPGTSVAEGALETVVARGRVRHLSGLVILAAEDHHVVIAVRFDSQVVIGIGGVPEERIGNLAPRHAAGDDVAGVERELGLEQRGAGDTGDPDERIVRRDDDVVAGQREAVDLDAERFRAEFLRVAVLVDVAAARGDRPREAREILARMKSRLIRRNGCQARRTPARRSTNRGVESQSLASAASSLKRVDLAGGGLAIGRVKIAVHPLERAVDLVLADDGIDLRDRGESRVPDGLRMGPPEPVHEIGEPVSVTIVRWAVV